MSKKVEEKPAKFDLEAGLKELEEPDWVVKAFSNQIDLTKVKNQSDLEKEFKKYMELKE